MKWAIRIVDGATGIPRLFAVVDEKLAWKYMAMARDTINKGSSDWIITLCWDRNPTVWPPNVVPPFIATKTFYPIRNI